MTAPYAAQPESQYLGESNPRGTVGEFLLVQSRGFILLAQLTKVELSQRDMQGASWRPSAPTPETPVGTARLLATVLADGSLRPGIEAMPRIGDEVFTAEPGVLRQGLGVVRGNVDLGNFSGDTSVPVSLSPEALFGRHLAVLGSTGGGKSWAVARLVEEIQRAGGRLILLDATGEYATLGGGVTHLVAGGGQGGVPLHEMSDLDRLLLFRPSAGSQLPRLNAAIASLRLVEALKGADSQGLVQDGHIKKASRPRADYQQAERRYADTVNNPHAPFNFYRLAEQIGYECVYANDRNNESFFGAVNYQEIGYCSTLMTRIAAIYRTPEVADFIAPEEGCTSILAELDEWISSEAAGVLRIDLSHLPESNNIREITVNTIGARLLARARRAPMRDNPLVVVIDEAHRFLGRALGEDQGGMRPESFELIAKEGRKFGLSVIVATQRPGDMPSGVLSQMGCLMVFRLTDRRDQEHISGASSHLDRNLANMLPALTPGECFVVGSALPIPLPVKVAAPENKPSSEGSRFHRWGEVSPV